jgi:hypothetical protein
VLLIPKLSLSIQPTLINAFVLLIIFGIRIKTNVYITAQMIPMRVRQMQPIWEPATAKLRIIGTLRKQSA